MGEQSDKTVDRVANEDADAEDFEGHRLQDDTADRTVDRTVEALDAGSEDDFEAHRFVDKTHDRTHDRTHD